MTEQQRRKAIALIQALKGHRITREQRKKVVLKLADRIKERKLAFAIYGK